MPPNDDASLITPAVPHQPESAERRATNVRRALDRRVSAVVEGMSDAFLAIGPDWRVTYANQEAARLNDVAPDALIGHSHWELWPETVDSEVERQYLRCVTERVPVQLEHHYPGANVWHDIRAYPADDGGIAIFYRDVTDQKRLAQEQARQARALTDAHAAALLAETNFRLVVERVRDYAIFLLDPNGIITHWGAGAERIQGWSAEEIVGRSLAVLYPDDAEDGSAASHIRHAAAHGEYIGEGTRLRRNGERFPARVVLTALRRENELVGFSKITQDLTGERERAAALTHAMAAVEAASTAKSQFLANTSHEIRTPLNAITGYTELLAMGLAGPLTAQQRRYVERIEGSSRHLLGLVNDVLDVAKIESGHMRASREAGWVREVVLAAFDLVEPQSRTRRVPLVGGCADDAIAYRGDVERVRQILVNLLSNAVRFTEAGGRVTVTCGATPTAPVGVLAPPTDSPDGWTYVRVEDTGIGIAPDQLDRIWSAFVQVDASRTRKFGGSGLGLTISRHLARLMGGDITVRSEPGVGSSFVLWLPAADPADVRSTPSARTTPDVAAPSTESADPLVMVAEVGGQPGIAQRLAEISDALLAETERVLSTYAARLRVDGEMSNARTASESQLEDHTATLLANIAQALTIVGQHGDEAATLLRDGATIQRFISERHGAQRAALGWQESEVRRDYRILREEVHAAVRRRLSRAGTQEEERALSVINHQLDEAERTSLVAFRTASSSAQS